MMMHYHHLLVVVSALLVLRAVLGRRSRYLLAGSFPGALSLLLTTCQNTSISLATLLVICRNYRLIRTRCYLQREPKIGGGVGDVCLRLHCHFPKATGEYRAHAAHTVCPRVLSGQTGAQATTQSDPVHQQ